MDSDLISLAIEAGHVVDKEFSRTRFARHVAACERADGPHGRASMIRDVLRTMLQRQFDALEMIPYPATVRELVRADFLRLETQLDQASEDYWDIDKYHVRSMFRITTFQRVLVGNEYIEQSGLSRQLILRDGLAQASKILMLRLTMGALRPLYEFHLAPWVTRIGREERLVCYRNVAACLEANPHVRGMMAGSWFYDPAMVWVSPYLAFLREIVTNNGGSLLKAGETADVRSMALSKSNTRRRLFEQGLYTPRQYIIVWPRKAMIRWAQSHE